MEYAITCVENKCGVEATMHIMHAKIAHETMPIVDQKTSKIKRTQKSENGE